MKYALFTFDQMDHGHLVDCSEYIGTVGATVDETLRRGKIFYLNLKKIKNHYSRLNVPLLSTK